jgi:hypothetical protein
MVEERRERGGGWARSLGSVAADKKRAGVGAGLRSKLSGGNRRNERDSKKLPECAITLSLQPQSRLWRPS